MHIDNSFKNTIAYKYAKKVVDGDIVAGEYIVAECERFLKDLERQKTDEYEWYFDTKTYDFIIGFQNFFKFADGVMAGQPMKLAEFQ